METYTLSDAAATVSSLPLTDAISLIDAAIQVCALADERLSRNGHPDEETESRRTEALSASEKALIRMRTKAKGALEVTIGIPIPDGTDRDIFRLLKCQQQELLCAMADEAAILADHLRRLRRLHRLLAAHSPRIHFSLTYQDIMRERLQERPTARLRVCGPGEPVAMLNAAIAGMQQYEDECVADLCRTVSGSDGSDKAHSSCIQLNTLVYQSVTDHRDRMNDLYRELQYGSKLLSALPKGAADREEYTPLLERHERRVREFQLSVERCRSDFFQQMAV